MAGVWIRSECMERDNERSFAIKDGGTSWPAERLKPVF